MVSKAKLARLDLSSVFDAVNKTLEHEARDLTKADFDQLLTGQDVCGYRFADKALSKKIMGREVGLVQVMDIETEEKIWLGVADKKTDKVFSGKRLSALEWKMSLAMTEENGQS